MAEAKTTTHYNLYYIFAADKQAHPMPQHWVDVLRAALFPNASSKPDVPP